MKKVTIIALVVAITAVFAVTATAAMEWNLYGSARVQTFYVSNDLGKELERTGLRSAIAVDRRDIANQDTVKTTRWLLENNSRIGATVKGDMLEARFEYGARPAVRDSGAITNFANVRRLYGTWKFAEGWGLKVGKDYTPITFFLSGQAFEADAGLLNVGNAYGARRGQIAVEGKLGPGMLKLALIDQTTSDLDTENAVTEVLFPKFEASYEFNITDAMSMHAFGGFQVYDIKTASPIPGTTIPQPTGTDSESVGSWMLGLGADLNFGPFFVKPQVSYYVNGAAAGWLGARYLPFTSQGFFQEFTDLGFDTTTLEVIQGNDVQNAKNLMAMLALGFKATESLGLEFGIGYVGYDTDSFNNFSRKNTYLEYYLNAVITMAPGVYLVPEIGYRDFGKEEGDKPIGFVIPDTDLGSLFYAGAKWQIDF
jgi:hypothetical protein